jgi:hypothetical protein
MWFTAADSTFQFSPQLFGTLAVVLDGKTIINAPLASMLNGNLGAPFVYPLVAGGTQSSGDGYIDIPMPFTCRCRSPPRTARPLRLLAGDLPAVRRR